VTIARRARRRLNRPGKVFGQMVIHILSSRTPSDSVRSETNDAPPQFPYLVPVLAINLAAIHGSLLLRGQTLCHMFVCEKSRIGTGPMQFGSAHQDRADSHTLGQSSATLHGRRRDLPRHSKQCVNNNISASPWCGTIHDRRFGGCLSPSSSLQIRLGSALLWLCSASALLCYPRQPRCAGSRLNRAGLAAWRRTRDAQARSDSASYRLESTRMPADGRTLVCSPCGIVPEQIAWVRQYGKQSFTRKGNVRRAQTRVAARAFYPSVADDQA